MESTVLKRFLKYISINTISDPSQSCIPSSRIQFDLANLLAEELKEIGASDVKVDEYCYVYATIPATVDANVPVLGLISHLDTAPDYPGEGVNPQFIKNYDGNDIVLNKETNTVIDVATYPFLRNYIGQDLITTDGTTLLGGDDKSGIAEIMAMAEYLLAHPEIPHGKIRIAFTPDEEIGCGTAKFDVEGFGADVGYTMDGGAVGEIQYENFNAASAKVKIHGLNIHPGTSKGKMKNSILIGMELQNMLPVFDNPMYTEGYEGFYHLNNIGGDVENLDMNYIIREHDFEKFTQRKEYFTQVVDFLNKKYGAGTVELDLKDSYYNMKEKVAPYMYLIDIAKEAMTEVGVEPKVVPIRGGTDGAHLSFEGLPCPNMGIGDHNAHGKYEFVCIQSMEQTVEILIRIAEKFSKLTK